MSGRAIYQRLTEAPDLTEEARRLSPAELTEVSVYISKLKGGGISAQVFGVVSALMQKSARKRTAKRERSRASQS
jgi:hypothetical protein